MTKQIILLLIFGITSFCANAQVTDTVLLNRLGSFDMATLNNDSYGAVIIGEKILPDTANLKPNNRTSFFAKLAKAYDDINQDDKAIVYYEKVAAASPNYYVAQRALGYLYNDRAEDIQMKLYATAKDAADYTALTNAYNNAVHKALPYLEKAQACDPDGDTLDLIKTLYMNIHDTKGLSTLKTRLPGLSKNCEDLLSE